jgi:hypothetical protein
MAEIVFVSMLLFASQPRREQAYATMAKSGPQTAACNATPAFASAGMSTTVPATLP